MHHTTLCALATLSLLACAPPADTPSTTRQSPLQAPVTLPGMTLLDAAPDGRALFGKLSPELPGSDAGLSYSLMFRDARGSLQPIETPAAESLLHPTCPNLVYVATTRGPLIRLDLTSGKRQELHPGPNLTGLAARGDTVAFTAGLAPDFDLFVASGDAAPERWTLEAAPRWQPFFFEDGALGFVTQEFGRPSVVSMTGPGFVPTIWSREPKVFPSRAPAPAFQGDRLYFTHARGVAAYDAQGALVWRQDGASRMPSAQGLKILDAAGKEVRP